MSGFSLVISMSVSSEAMVGCVEEFKGKGLGADDGLWYRSDTGATRGFLGNNQTEPATMYVPLSSSFPPPMSPHPSLIPQYSARTDTHSTSTPPRTHSPTAASSRTSTRASRTGSTSIQGGTCMAVRGMGRRWVFMFSLLYLSCLFSPFPCSSLRPPFPHISPCPTASPSRQWGERKC